MCDNMETIIEFGMIIKTEYGVFLTVSPVKIINDNIILLNSLLF